MFDLSDAAEQELLTFCAEVRQRLASQFSEPVLTTEHGRVGLCEEGDRHDAHCYHAHQLLFPVTADISSVLAVSEFAPLTFQSFSDARGGAGHLTEYLYYEPAQGQILVGTYPASRPRQFFRAAVAREIGHPELASWRSTPNLEQALATAKLLCR